MLYPTNIGFTQDFLDKQFQLDKRIDLFKAVENAIVKLGMDIAKFLYSKKFFVSKNSNLILQTISCKRC